MLWVPGSFDARVSRSKALLRLASHFVVGKGDDRQGGKPLVALQRLFQPVGEQCPAGVVVTQVGLMEIVCPRAVTQHADHCLFRVQLQDLLVAARLRACPRSGCGVHPLFQVALMKHVVVLVPQGGGAAHVEEERGGITGQQKNIETGDELLPVLVHQRSVRGQVTDPGILGGAQERIVFSFRIRGLGCPIGQPGVHAAHQYHPVTVQTR